MHAQRKAASEAELWRMHLMVLTQDLRMRKPDGPPRLRSEAARLDREVEALMARRKLAERAAGSEGSAMLDQLGEAIAERLRRVSDLAALTQTYGGRPKTEDLGPNAECVIRPSSVDPVEMLFGKGRLSEDQYRAAREIAWVYEAITRAGRAAVCDNSLGAVLRMENPRARDGLFAICGGEGSAVTADQLIGLVRAMDELKAGQQVP